MNQARIDHLNRELATAQMILLNTKRYHWMVSGPHFRDYHLRFDELYQAVLPMVDDLGERIRMLGGTPIHAPNQILEGSVVPASDPAQTLAAQPMLAEALAAELQIIEFMHEGIDLATRENDPGTADLLTGFVQVHQKEAWFLRVMQG